MSGRIGEHAPRGSGTVLVVDDCVEARALAVRILHRRNLTCIEAGAGTEALELALANVDVLDAILLDVMMPDMTGFEVARCLNRIPSAAGIPIIFLTGAATTRPACADAVVAKKSTMAFATGLLLGSSTIPEYTTAVSRAW